MRTKRFFDFVGALAGLLLLAPLLLLLAATILASSGRPVCFRQSRAGRHGRDFVLLKFRTMSVVRAVDCSTFDAGNNRRVTPIGRFLRSTKLDELPQLWNVLTGDMSLVGPRPEVRTWVNAYADRWAEVLALRPGITDPAAIIFRNEEEILARSPDPEMTYREEILPRKLDLYEEYVRTRTFWGDIRIIVRTLMAIAKG